MSAMAKFEKHIFICTNQRDVSSPRGCCDPNGQGELQKQFKEKLKARGLKARFRANKAGCLDQCEHGPNIVVYPEAVWYGGRWGRAAVKNDDSHFRWGKTVARTIVG